MHFPLPFILLAVTFAPHAAPLIRAGAHDDGTHSAGDHSPISGARSFRAHEHAWRKAKEHVGVAPRTTPIRTPPSGVLLCVVTSSDDTDSVGSIRSNTTTLRGCLNKVNRNAKLHTSAHEHAPIQRIEFAPRVTGTISVTQPLPFIYAPFLAIDACYNLDQRGGNLVHLTGVDLPHKNFHQKAVEGLVFMKSAINAMVCGLAITAFPSNGLVLNGADARVLGPLVADGNGVGSLGGDGVIVKETATNCTLGTEGTTAVAITATNNKGIGIAVMSTDCRIANVLVGLSVQAKGGRMARGPNRGSAGLWVSPLANGCVIGATRSGGQVVVGANVGNGINIYGPGQWPLT